MTTGDHDERWDEMALGHVLGGLEQGDASEFRGHLAGCGQCRARVAELRSLASDLAAAEREERTTQRLRTQIDSRRELERAETAETDEERAQLRIRRRALVAAVVIVLVLFVLTVWNANLRSQNVALREVAASHTRTLTTFGAGSVVPAQTSGSVTGAVSVDGDRVAYSLAGLPTPDTGERLVVWLEAGGEVARQAVHLPQQLVAEQGRLASTVSAPDATRLLVTVESVAVPERPAGPAVVEADLDVSR